MKSTHPPLTLIVEKAASIERPIIASQWVLVGKTFWFVFIFQAARSDSVVPVSVQGFDPGSVLAARSCRSQGLSHW